VWRGAYVTVTGPAFFFKYLFLFPLWPYKSVQNSLFILTLIKTGMLTACFTTETHGMLNAISLGTSEQSRNARLDKLQHIMRYRYNEFFFELLSSDQFSYRI
jgi:hypothetical protein